MSSHSSRPRRRVARSQGAPGSDRPNWTPQESRKKVAAPQPTADDSSSSSRRRRRRRSASPAGAAQPAGAPHSAGGQRSSRPAEHHPRGGRTGEGVASSGAGISTSAPSSAGKAVTFTDLGLDHRIVQVLNRHSITEPFPIQAAAIPDALAGRDVLGRGPTGSGKTFTFGLPMLQRLAGASSTPGRPRAVVLEPTRELATQVAERLADPAAAVGLRVLAVVGGVNIKRHVTALASPVDVLVATPGRAQDLINQRELSFDDVVITAVDEADQMADMGFLPQVRKLLDLTPHGQRLLFSATLDGDVNVLVKRYMTRPVTHETAPVCGAVDTMTHYRLLVGSKQDRWDIAEAIAAREGRTIMFVRTRHGVDRQVKKLRRAGINAMGLHGDKGQNTREKTLAGFADGSVPVLVATDIAARGIDIDDVSLVVHVDPPAEHKAYMHRAGRTARGGDSGVVVTLVMDDQVEQVRSLFKATGVDAPEITVTADSPELARLTGARLAPGVPLAPAGGPRPRRRSAGGTTQGGRPRRSTSRSSRR